MEPNNSVIKRLRCICIFSGQVLTLETMSALMSSTKIVKEALAKGK